MISKGRIFILCLSFLMAFLTVIFLYSFQQYLIEYETKHLCIGTTLIMAGSIILLTIIKEKKIWSISSIYLVVFTLFHGGLILAIGFDLKLSELMRNYIVKWFFSENAKISIIIVSIAISAYMVGTIATEFMQPKKKEVSPVGSGAISQIGFVMLVVAFCVWLGMIVRQGGFSLLAGPYGEYLEHTSGSLRGWLNYFIGIGFIFLAVSPPSWLRRVGILVFALFALLAFPLGLRGEVLFPLFTALAVIGMKKYPLSLSKALILGVCLLSAISLVKQVRQVGLKDFQFVSTALSPANGLAEMGASIRPLVEVVSWSRVGESYLLGASYLAPIDRSLVYLIPGWRRPPVLEDTRLLGLVMQKRAGSVGFSALAEAHRNFGIPGVIFIMMALGYLFGRMDHWAADQYWQLTAGVVLFPLMIHIRNSFIFVPATLVIGLTIVYLSCKLLKIEIYSKRKIKV